MNQWKKLTVGAFAAGSIMTAGFVGVHGMGRDIPSQSPSPVGTIEILPTPDASASATPTDDSTSLGQTCGTIKEKANCKDACPRNDQKSCKWDAGVCKCIGPKPSPSSSVTIDYPSPEPSPTGSSTPVF